MAGDNKGTTSYFAGALIADVMPDAVIAYSDAGVTSKLVINEWRAKADTIRVNKWNLGTNVIDSSDVASHTEGADTTSIYLNSDAATITPAGYTVRVDLTEESILSNAGSPAQQIGLLIGNAIRAKQDNLLNALFDAFTGNAIDASTTALTVDHLYEAYGLIDEDSDGMMPLSGVFYPKQLNGTYGLSNDLITSTSFAGGATQDQGLRTASYGRVAGIDLFRSREFSVANSAVKAGVFRRDALALGTVGYSAAAPFKLTVDYDDQAANYHNVGFMFGGVIEVNDNYGCEIWTKYV
jgi:hypothetical protein